jgi:hypothetical protein
MKHVILPVVFLLLLAAGCARVLVPPRVDLTAHQTVGIIRFESDSKGKLAPFATRKFMEWARHEYSTLRIAELGTRQEVLDELDRGQLGPDAFREIGKRYEASTVATGQLEVSDVRPDITITPGFGFVDFSAEVDARLSVRLVETSSGATIWSRSATATRKVAGVSVFGRGGFLFDAEDPERAYGKLVNDLAKKVTEDFRKSWECRCR